MVFIYTEQYLATILFDFKKVSCFCTKRLHSDTAIKCLKLLSGRRHRVISGISLVLPCGKQYVKSVTSVVAFKRLTDAEISGYIASGEWDGKAGGYAIQGFAASFVRFMSGSYSNIVGLPLFEVAGWLHTHLKETDKP